MSSGQAAAFRLAGRLIDQGLNAVEYCTLAFHPGDLTLSINASSLHSFTVDDVEAVATFVSSSSSVDPEQQHSPHHRRSASPPDNATSCIAGRGFPIVLVFPGHNDYVIACDDDPLPLVRQLQEVKRARKAKLIHYQLNQFDTFIVEAVSNGCVRWRDDDPPALIPFPHGRLDFLKFHTNRSVMAKLSSFNDSRVEASFDRVSACAHAFVPDAMEGDTGAGSSDALPRRVDDMTADLAMGRGRSAALLALDTTPFVDDIVLILGDLNVYITERTGTLRLRLPLRDIQVAMLVTRDRSGKRLSDPMLLLLTEDEGAVWVTTKYAADLLHRLVALRRDLPPGTAEDADDDAMELRVLSADHDQQPTPAVSPAGQSKAREASPLAASPPPLASQATTQPQAVSGSTPPLAATTAQPNHHQHMPPPQPSATRASQPDPDGVIHELMSSPLAALGRGSAAAADVGLRSFATQTAAASQAASPRREGPADPLLGLPDELGDTQPTKAMLRRQVSELRQELKGKNLLLAMRQAVLSTAPHGSSAADASSGSVGKRGGGYRSTTPRRGRGGGGPTRHASASQQSSGGADASEEWPLRFYVTLLEREIERLTHLDLEQRVVALEEVHASEYSDDDDLDGGQQQADDVTLLKYNLRESERRERALERRCAELEAELSHTVASNARIVEDLSGTALAAVEKHLQTQQEARRAELARRRAATGSDTTAWELAVRDAEAFEDRVQQEVTVRLASNMATVASLTEELRKREEQIGILGRELDTYFASAPDELDRHNAHTCVAAIQRLADRAAGSREQASLSSTVAGLETKVRSLLRQIDDLKHSRDRLVEEGRDVFGIVVDETMKGPSRVEALQTQVETLRRMQHVQLLTAQVAELTRVARNSDQAKTAALEARAALRVREDELAKLDAASKSAARELANARASVQKTERELHVLRENALASQQALERAETKHRREVHDLRNQLKALRHSNRPGTGSSSFADRSRSRSTQRAPDSTAPRQRQASQSPVTPTSDRRRDAHDAQVIALSATRGGVVPPLELPESPQPATALDFAAATRGLNHDDGTAALAPHLTGRPPTTARSMDRTTASPRPVPSTARSTGSRHATTSRSPSARELARITAHGEALRRRAASLDASEHGGSPRRSLSGSRPRQQRGASPVAKAFGVVDTSVSDDPIARTKERFAKMKERLQDILPATAA